MLYSEYFKLFMADVVFKQAFLANNYALEDFLECLMNLPKHYLKNRIKDIKCEYYLKKNNIKDKDRRCDMLIYFDDVELNLEFYTSFSAKDLRKSVTYECKLFFNQNKTKPLKTIQYNIITKNTVLPKEEFIHEYRLINEYNLRVQIFNEHFKVICINLDNVEKVEYNLDNRFEKWCKFLKASSIEEMDKISKGDEVLMKLIRWFKKYLDDKETTRYFQEWAEENKYLNGVDEGTENGIKIGTENGIKIGTEKTLQDTATKMLKKNYKSEDISEITGLTKEKINELRTTLF